MIVCPVCKETLLVGKEVYYCEKCKYQAPVKDGTIYFSNHVDSDYENYDAKGLDNLYEFENRHFWFKNRRQVIVEVFDKYIQKTDKVIEIGAGTGNVARTLLKNGYNISVGEIHSSGLEYAKSYGIEGRYQVDIFESPFQEHFDVVSMFDVLEHFQNESLALQNVYSMLKPGGKLVLTVPAHQWLWNRDDEIALHKRRYTLKYLTDVLEKNSFEIVESKHFFLAILPLLYLRTFLHPPKRNYDIKKDLKEFDMSMNPFINWILDKVTWFENIVIKNHQPLFGGSIICVARKSLLSRTS
jgi:2-polyprenyl-3-methyl-5-hydroxy-6-metoxy-1,4-benzoquinol methylase